ncbi:hypothetical protein B7463_g8674, partial [Scytalidium lignicola]
MSHTSSASFTSTASTLFSNDFQPARSFTIHAHGIPVIRIPGPSPEIEIPITESDGKPKYKSIRSHRWSSSFVLNDAQGQNVATVDGDRFSNFPLRTIGIELNGKGSDDKVKMKRKALMTRACVFEYGGDEWAWRYGKRNEGAKMNGHTLLVLEKNKISESVRVAQLVRDKETDAQGDTTKYRAGRGGRLDISRELNGTMEVLIVTSCLIMLKKEIDRRGNARGVPIIQRLVS